MLIITSIGSLKKLVEGLVIEFFPGGFFSSGIDSRIIIIAVAPAAICATISVPIGVNARLIQTTTPVSHGNSGGPLVDMKGMVVGVNTMTFRPLGGENVNFAVAAVELPPLLLAKNETPSPLPTSDPAAGGVRRILSRASDHVVAGECDRAGWPR